MFIDLASGLIISRTLIGTFIGLEFLFKIALHILCSLEALDLLD